MCSVQIVSSCLPALQQLLLKLLQGSWHSSSSFWGSRIESRVQIPSTLDVIMIIFPSFKSLHKQPVQLAHFKPNSFPVIDKLLPTDQPVYEDWNIIWGRTAQWSEITSELTPCSRVLLQKLMFQGVNKFPAFHFTGRFMTLLTRARHLSLQYHLS